MSDSLKGPDVIPFLKACTIIFSSLVCSLTTCAPKRMRKSFQGLFLILSYVVKIVRDWRGSPVGYVLLPEQHRELRKLCHMPVKEADEPIKRCVCQRAHEHLAMHYIRTSNQHHLGV